MEEHKMLRLSANKEKELTFEVQIGGVNDFDQIESFFRIVFEGIEYGFPCKVTSEAIQVNLPPLNKVIAKRIREGDEVDIKLEVVVDGNYLIPWRDRAKLSNPLVIEAKIKDKSFVDNPEFETKLITSKGDQKQGVIVKEKEQIDEVSEEYLDKIAEKIAAKIKPTSGVKVEVEKTAIEEKEEVQKEKDIEQLVSEKVKNLTTKKPKKKNKISKMTLQEKKDFLQKKLTKEAIFRYMEKEGTKNPKVQKIIYEQAKVASETGELLDIFKNIVRFINEKR